MSFHYIEVFPVGILIASLASMLGVSGGIMWVPYLILVEGLAPKEAVGLSFLIQMVGMGSGTFSYIRKKKVLWHLVKDFIPFLLMGITIGATLAHFVVKSSVMQFGLGIIALLVGLSFAFQIESYEETLQEKPPPPSIPYPIRFITSGFATLSGLFSIGMGDFLIPILRGKLKISMQNAIATTLTLNFSAALTGGILHNFVFGSLYAEKFSIFIFAGMGVFIGGQLGPALSERVSEERLKELFIFLLMLIGLHLIYQAL